MPHAMPAVPQSMPMDREFILRNQIPERYLAGRLPIRGAQDFERYCREHPGLIDEIGLAERVHAGLRLLEAGGVSSPWEAPTRKWWEQLPVMIAALVLACVAAIAAMVLWGKLAGRDATIASLQQAVAEQPLQPATSTRTVRLVPSRTAPSRRAAVTLGSNGAAQMADLKIDMSWSKFTAFRVTLDRQDQGRVAVLNYMLRDSNGDLRVSLNSTALGPGIYEFAIEGLTLRGEAVAQAWMTIGIAH
ncbi:MAG: hypothetical protein KGL25_13500 [Gammaproteobacteria bacterium]|nr:hypothetical protein [Gammaproteobacteria bacterium]